MKIAKKISAILSLLLVFSLALGTFCYAEEVQEPEWPEFTDEVTITWWNWLSVPEKVIEGFNEVYPNIHVEAPLVGSGTELYNKYTTVMQAGSGAPDVIQIEYQYLPQFIDAGYLEDISSYVSGSLDSFIPWTIGQCSRGDAVYAMPQDVGPNALIYRKDVFDKYDIEVPTTYAEMEEAAAKLHEANPDMYFTYFPTNCPGMITGFLWQVGSRPFHYDTESGKWEVNINDDASKAVLEYWGDLVDKGYVKATANFTPEFNAEIASGEYAAFIAPAWFHPNFVMPYLEEGTDQEWAIGDALVWDAQNPTNGNWGGSTYGVSTQSKNKEAAAIFVEWVSASNYVMELDQVEGGRGLQPSNANWAKSEGFSKGDATLVNGSEANKYWSNAANIVDTSFEWSPWTDFVYSCLDQQITNAVNKTVTWSQALDNVQEDVVMFAGSMGYDIK